VSLATSDKPEDETYLQSQSEIVKYNNNIQKYQTIPNHTQKYHNTKYKHKERRLSKSVGTSSNIFRFIKITMIMGYKTDQQI